VTAPKDAVRRDGAGAPERLLRSLAAAAFLIFFQAYMVAPLIPRFSALFDVPAQAVGLIIPAYMVPYGIATLFYGPLADRYGPRSIILASLGAFVVLTALTATARTADQLVAWRFLTGLGASGVVPLALVLMGRLYPYEQRGRPLGWLFGAMAGGMAMGSTVGVILEPFIGWRWLFAGVAMAAAGVLFLLVPYRALMGWNGNGGLTLRRVFGGYGALLSTRRGRRTYTYVFCNAVFHSGVFTWLGVYLFQRYHLSEVGIGLALLGYGMPGFLLGPVIGRLADRWSRRWLLPAGLCVAAVAAAALIPSVPLVAAALAITALSLGYDMTEPLLAGIVTALDGERGGQAIGLMAFVLFSGFGLGSLLFGALLRWGFDSTLLTFAAVQMVSAILAVAVFRSETTARSREGLPPSSPRVA
jgi:predicted MFS family arabinose efflux permease